MEHGLSCTSNVLSQRWNPCPLHWQLGSLTLTGPPKSWQWYFGLSGIHALRRLMDLEKLTNPEIEAWVTAYTSYKGPLSAQVTGCIWTPTTQWKWGPLWCQLLSKSGEISSCGSMWFSCQSHESPPRFLMEGLAEPGWVCPPHTASHAQGSGQSWVPVAEGWIRLSGISLTCLGVNTLD